MSDADTGLRIDCACSCDRSSEENENMEAITTSPISWAWSNDLSYDTTVPNVIFSGSDDVFEDSSNSAELRADEGAATVKLEPPSPGATLVRVCELPRSGRMKREVDSVLDMPYNLSGGQETPNGLSTGVDVGVRKSTRKRRKRQVDSMPLRAQKKAVPEEEKDRKYREFREKNNESARKSRQRKAYEELLKKDSWLDIFGSEMDDVTKNVMREVRGSFGQQLLRVYEMGYRKGMEDGLEGTSDHTFSFLDGRYRTVQRKDGR